MRRRTVLLGVAAVAVTGTGAAGVTLSGGGTEAAEDSGRLPPATATVERRDLADHKTVGGTLGFEAERVITSGRSGTVTSVPAAGARITRGKALYGVDRLPVTLLYGTTPLYRTLEAGVTDGPDVRQLERNLSALGHGGGLTVDDHFSAATAAAVIEWQARTGHEQNGAVDAGQAAFLPGAVRVKEAKPAVGSPAKAGAEILTVTGTRRVVTVPLDVADQQMARKGAKVGVELPGGVTTTGRISSIGTVAAPPPDDDSGTGSATITVLITLDDPGKTGRLDEAPVSVELAGRARKGVLSVPVTALVALREGGLGVQVVEGARTRLVAVRPGIYAGGRVEITGTGIAEGMKVGVPRS